jgi:small-conductance mechanosensitive channel
MLKADQTDSVEESDAPPQESSEAANASNAIGPQPENSTDPAETPDVEELLGADGVLERVQSLVDWMRDQMLSFDSAIQALIVLGAVIPAILFGPHIRSLITSQVSPRVPFGILRRASNALAHVATPVALYVVLQIAVVVFKALERPSVIVEAMASLLAAWIVIRLVTLVIRSPFWSRLAFYLVWPIAALDAFGFLGPLLQQLDQLGFQLGTGEDGKTNYFSALDVIRMLVVFLALFWIANTLNRFVKGRIEAVDELTPSLKALLAKVLDVLTPVMALLIALQLVGFNLATLTIFGGAVGLGIGLGLQRTISNFFAGFTLIADRSIKPGDVIEVADSFGWVTQMNARYVSIRTRDGMSHLVPNDKFIEDGVINWSHADRVVRLHAPFGVSYSSRDLRAICSMAEATVLEVDRVLKTPAPKCNVVEFGDSSVNFDLRFWINDPANGVANVKSAVFLAIWDKLHEMGVEIPFPQRDLHIKTAPAELFPDIAALEPGRAQSKPSDQ